jgi:hypothetical protein
MLVDTNVLVDVLENDTTWADWSIAQQRAQAQIHRFRGLLHGRPAGLPVLTGDVGRYASYFPTVRLIAPEMNGT